MTKREVDHEVASLARRQHGAFATRQVVAMGASNSLLRRRVNAGLWLPVDRGVLVFAGSDPTWERQLKIAELGHPEAMVSGRPSASLHGLGFGPGRPEITVPRGCHHRTPRATVRRRDEVTSTVIDHIRVTDLPQTVVDLAGVLPAPRLLGTVETALLHHGLDPGELQRRAQLAGVRRLRGAATLQRVVTQLLEAEAPSMSALERRLREVLRLAGFHDARFEAAPPWWPEGPERVDVLLEVERVIVEGDGRAWHQRVADFENDRRRDNLAALHGYRVVRLTWTMVTRLRAATVRDLRRLRVPAA